MSFSRLIRPFDVVFGNPQSWLAGIIGGLLFVPTTIGAMVWAASFLHYGQHVSIADAATDASMVPIGWIIVCPLLGYVSDRIGQRKPVLLGGAVLMLASGIAAVYLPDVALPRYSVPLLLGIGSGAAMIPFTMIKEANPAEVKGTALNPGGRPKDLVGFRERCRERTLEVVEILESVFFTGHWPNRQKFVSDTVRIQAGMMLVANGWGTPPSSHEISITLPQLPPRIIDRDMSNAEASRIYEATLRHGHYDDSGGLDIEQRLIDVTPNKDEGESS